MATAQQFAGALQGLSGGLGALGGYEAQKEMMAAQQAEDDRKEAASRAFQAALFNARAQQDQQQFDATLSARKDENAATLDYRNRSLNEESQYHQDSLAQQEELRRAQLGIEGKRLGIEQQNADSERLKAETDKQVHAEDRTSMVLSNRLSATGRLLQSYTKQRDAEIARLDQDPGLMGDPASKSAAAEKINAKYQPLIDKRQHEYDALNKKFAEKTGVDFGDAETAAETAPLGSAGASGAPGAPGPSASAPDDGSLDGTDAQGLPLAGLPSGNEAGTPNPETPPVKGARRAPDGYWYVPDPKRPGKWLRVDQ